MRLEGSFLFCRGRKQGDCHSLKYRYFEYVKQVSDVIPECAESLLDCGVGFGLFGVIAKHYWRMSRVVGLDIEDRLLGVCKNYGCYDELYHVDLTQDQLPFKDKMFDVALLTEVIEHLSKEQGFRILRELERVAKTVVVTTPAIQFDEPSHISLWTPEDFRSRGYDVHGFGYFLLFGRYVKWVSFLLRSLTHCFPSTGVGLLGVKQT